MHAAIRRLSDRVFWAGRSRYLYALCKRYVDLFGNDNNGDMAVNGERRLIRELLPGCAIAFDVGANIGEWTRHALAASPEVRIHCFEPSPVTFRRLLANGFGDRVICNNLGLGDRIGEATLFVDGDCSGGNSLYRRPGGGFRAGRTERVQICTLDHYCREQRIERIDFLKIDVEGHELAVLKGARRMLGQGRLGTVQFEYGGTYLDARVLLKDVWEYVALIAPEYKFFKLYPDGPRHVSEYRQSLESFQLSTWVLQAPGHAGAASNSRRKVA